MIKELQGRKCRPCRLISPAVILLLTRCWVQLSRQMCNADALWLLPFPATNRVDLQFVVAPRVDLLQKHIRLRIEEDILKAEVVIHRLIMSLAVIDDTAKATQQLRISFASIIVEPLEGLTALAGAGTRGGGNSRLEDGRRGSGPCRSTRSTRSTQKHRHGLLLEGHKSLVHLDLHGDLLLLTLAQSTHLAAQSLQAGVQGRFRGRRGGHGGRRRRRRHGKGGGG